MKHATDFEMSKENKIISTTAIVLSILTWIVFTGTMAIQLLIAVTVAMHIKDFVTGVDKEIYAISHKNRQLKASVILVSVIFAILAATTNFFTATAYLLIPTTAYLVGKKYKDTV